MHAGSDEARERQSNCYWQLVPSHVHAHKRDLGGFILVDRRYMRALCVKDGQLRQYQSDELHMLLHVDRKGMVREHNGEHAIIEPAYASAIWNLDPSGAINQPYQDLYLSAAADGGSGVSVQRRNAAGYPRQWDIVAL